MSALRWLLGLLLLSSPALADTVDDAEALLLAERPGAAMRLLQDHLSAGGDDDVAAHELLIDIQLNGGLADTVREVYLQRARDQPGDADTWYLFGRATMNPGESDRAYEQAIALQPGHARALTGRAALQRAMGQPAAAVPLYVEALSHDSTLLEAWSGLWSAQLLQEDLPSAALTAERASEAIPGHPEPWLTLALLRPDQARRYLTSGLTHNPGDYRLTVDYARQLFREQELSGAEQAYAAAVAVAGDDPTVRVEAALLSEIGTSALSWSGAQVLIDTRTQPTAAEALRHASGVVSQHPRSVLARVVRGNLYQIQDDLTAAEADYKAALALSPDSTEANAALGLLLLSTRRPAEAIGPLKQATAQRPGDVALGLAAAVALAEGSDPGAGGMALLELEERFPYDAGPPLALAQLLMGLGEAERAYVITLEAVQRMPEPQLMLALAATARAAGRPAEAAAALRKLGERTGDPRFEQAARQLQGAGQD